MKQLKKKGKINFAKYAVCAILIAAIPLPSASFTVRAERAQSVSTSAPGEGAYYRLWQFSCARLTPLEYVERITGAKVVNAKLVHHEDDHGGFHGDGSTRMEIDCSETADELEASMSAWRELPMSDKLYNELFNHTITNVKNGLYFFENRSPEARSSLDENISDAHSLNFTFAVYDREAKMLYYFELDT